MRRVARLPIGGTVALAVVTSAAAESPGSGRTALVTGAGSGIGRAIALALSEAGMAVTLVGRRACPLQEVAAQRPNMTVVPADITTEDGIGTLRDRLPAVLNVLVHAAGAFDSRSIVAADLAAWSNLLAANLHGPMRLTAACVERLERAAGLAIFINSTAGLPASNAPGLYATTKQGMRAATDSLRQELAPRGISVLSIFPGRTDTPMQQQVLAAEGRPGAAIPLMQPQDVAAMVMAVIALPRSAEVTEITMRPVWSR